ncbi:hypothetical protein OROGR_005594 [Orobanche gracilis]
MLNFICNRTSARNARNSYAIVRSFASELYVLEFHQPYSSPSSSLSSSSSVRDDSGKESIAISYLENSCGFSPARALSATKYLSFKTPERADSVLAFLKKHQFSDAQISTLIKRRPPILLSKTEETLFPKIEFLKSIGIPKAKIPILICRAPNLLSRSLTKRIIPAFNFLKSSLSSSEDVLFAINRYPDLLTTALDAKVEPNLEILREAGVPERGILYCLKQMPMVLVQKMPEKLRECIERVKQIGFRPETNMFLQGVKVLALTVDSTWEHKVEVYKKCGWSEEEVIESFRKHPCFMLASESKVMAVVDILVHKMGYRVSDIARYPVVVLLSLEKTVVPRCSVYQVLLLKGLAKENLSFCKWLVCTEKSFLEMFLLCHEKEAPELLKLYREKMGLSKRVTEGNNKKS